MSKTNQPENLVFTQERVEVSQRIKDGKTLFYKCKKEATAFATSIRTYVYEAFNKDGFSIGYCVPK